MQNIKRYLIMMLVLCLVLPMCLVTIHADAAEPVSYKLFCDEMKSLDGYATRGNVALKKHQATLDALYASKALNVVPYAYNGSATPYINYSGAETGDQFLFDGLKIQQGKIGDWVALKFRSPGEGYFSVSFSFFFLNQNNSAQFSAYLLPGNTAAASITGLLTEDNLLGYPNIATDSAKLQEHSLSITTGAELNAGKEYLLVLKADKDLHNPDTGRIDFMLTGLSFGEGYKPGEGAFNPLLSEIAFDNPVTVAEFYRAVNGVHPSTGHDLMYLMFKGGDMLVYDIDTQEIIDKEYIHQTQTKGDTFDKNGNLWICGSGNNIIKYDPVEGKITRYLFDYSMVNNIKKECAGIVYGDDGMLYFGYYGWLFQLNPDTGKFVQLGGKQLITTPGKECDGQFTGNGGLIYKDGYLYFAIYGDLNGDQIYSGQVIKYDIANQKVAQYIDVIDSMRTDKFISNYGFVYLNYIDGILYGTYSGRPEHRAYIDISGDTMVRLDSIPTLDADLLGAFSGEVNGKYYMCGYVDNQENSKCVYEYDVATKTFRQLTDIFHLANLNGKGQSIATIEGNDKLPGYSLVTARNNSATGEVDIILYNTQTMETVIYESVTQGYGVGVSLTGFEADPTGRYLYTGGYGNNKIAICDTLTGEVKVYTTHSHQIDDIYWYDGYLWIGNYNVGTISKFDPETGDVKPLLETYGAVWRNRRMVNGTGGDGRVYFAGTPDNGRSGGILAWYDIERDLTYIASGPNPENVHYAKTTASFVVWRNAATHEVETFDIDGDGFYNADITLDDKGTEDVNDDDVVQHVYGVFSNRVICCLNYVDGLLYGATTKTNGNNVYYAEGNAELFVYDPYKMQLVATCDLADHIDGLENTEDNTIQWIDALAPDPYETGKFWGTVCDTLFSMTYDVEAKTFSIKEELSFGKNREWQRNGNDKLGKSILFDGDYMFVSFQHEGTYMIKTSDTSVRYQVSATPAEQMVRLPDGNIYHIGGRDGLQFQIKVWNTAPYTQPLIGKSVQEVIDSLPEVVTIENEQLFMDAYNMYMDLIDETKANVNADKLLTAIGLLEIDQVAKADALIDAIGTVTLESLPAIQAARWYYDSLPEAAQAKVTKLSVLEAAEEAYLELKEASEVPAAKPSEPTAPENAQGGSTILYIAIGAVVLIAAVAVVVVLKKKKSEE